MPWLTHARVCPSGPQGRAVVITPPTPAVPNGPPPADRKSPIPTTSRRRIIPMPVMPNTSSRPSPSLPAASHASRPTWTLTCSYEGQVADTVGTKAASGPRCSRSRCRSGLSSVRAASTARFSSRLARRPTSASSAGRPVFGTPPAYDRHATHFSHGQQGDGPPSSTPLAAPDEVNEALDRRSRVLGRLLGEDASRRCPDVE